MLRSKLVLYAALVLFFAGVSSEATLITFTPSTDSGVAGGGSTGVAYNGPINQNDLVNIALFAQSGDPPDADNGVGTFELAFDYDPTKLEPQVHATAKMLSAFGLSPGQAPNYCWVADVLDNFATGGFPTTAVVLLDTGNHLLTLKGGAEPGAAYKNQGSDDDPILIGQITFKALVDLTSSFTTVDVTGNSLNKIGGWQSGDQVVLFGSGPYDANSGTGEIIVGVPEPTSVLLVGLGATVITCWRRRRRT